MLFALIKKEPVQKFVPVLFLPYISTCYCSLNFSTIRLQGGMKMEKYYTVVGENYINAFELDRQRMKKRDQFVYDFFKRNNILGESYMVCGTRARNIPLNKDSKKYIELHIEDRKENRDLFVDQLEPSRFVGFCQFKNNTEILERFRDECVKNKIVINWEKAKPSEWFIDILGCHTQKFQIAGQYYLLVNTDELDNLPIVPKGNGLLEISMDEYYEAMWGISED